jgi:membrane protein DedA with SNARE-associated domain
VDLWVSFWSDLTNEIAQHGLLTVAVVVLVKSAGVPLPVPADLLIIWVGVDARANAAPLWPVWALLSAATTAGAWALYEFTRWVGAEDVVRYGHYVGLSSARIENAERQLRNRGRSAIFLARVVPGLRLAIVVTSAIALIPRRMFVAAVFLGAAVYVGGCLAIGYGFGAVLAQNLGQLVFPAGLVIPFALVGILLIWLWRARRALQTMPTSTALSRTGRLRAGALSGALAAGGSGQLVNVYIYLGGPIVASGATSGVIDRLVTGTASSALLFVFGATVSSVVIGIGWGAVYGLISVQRGAGWPDSVRGIVFGTLPLIGLVLLLLAVAIALGYDPQQTGIAALVGEIVRWVAYGVFLGLLYPVFRARRAQTEVEESVRCL